MASLPEAERKKVLSLTEEQARELLYDWRFWGRPSQQPPEGDWQTWLIMAGRGAGKTRAGSEWVRSTVTGPTPFSAGRFSRFALVAETAADARDVMVEGESGLLAVHPRGFRPLYEPSKRRLTWPNGAIATIYNASEPDQLRGPQSDAAWCDELAKWQYARETWDMLQFGLRLGDRPQQLITTTPRPIALLREIMAAPDTVITRDTTFANSANLPPSFIEQVVRRYEGTRLGRQELNAEILDDVAGALWSRSGLDGARRKPGDLPDMQRVVVGVDPAASLPDGGENLAETGIVVAGLGVDGRGYVLADLSCRLGPEGWARRAISGLDMYDGDAIVAETNQGGAMVAATIRAVRATAKVIEVHASRGKVTRAEPISALYEQGRVSHVGTLPDLEDQMMLFTPFGIEGSTTGDRVDALVWALTELFPRMTRKRAAAPVKIEGASGYEPHRWGVRR